MAAIAITSRSENPVIFRHPETAQTQCPRAILTCQQKNKQLTINNLSQLTYHNDNIS
jgi:hypothetical protein